MKSLLLLTLSIASVSASEWKLIWSDEFDRDGAPDPAKWGYEEGFLRNQEMQYYTRDRRENVRVENGVLVIEGRKEKMKNPAHKAGSTDWRTQRDVAEYTSGSINTLGKAAFLYGRVEVRAKVPRGAGAWPAIWMMGVNIREVGWPRCGEVDILEYVGKKPHTMHANNHFADPGIKDRPVHRSAGGGQTMIEEPWNNFHVFAIEWDEKQICFFVDDKPYARLDIDAAGKGADNPFRKPHYLLLNLALGGNWGGPIDDASIPQRYQIDYVRIYGPGRGRN